MRRENSLHALYAGGKVRLPRRGARDAAAEGVFSDDGAAASRPPFAPSAALNGRVALWAGDITRLSHDAIVNAANNRGLGGGGVDGAIHDAAGDELYDEMKKLPTLAGFKSPTRIRTGDAVLTPGFKLRARHVVHTVGPIGEQPALLRSAYRRSLDVAVRDRGLKSIAFPCISTGVYDYPNAEAAAVALGETRAWMEEHPAESEGLLVTFVLFMAVDKKVYQRLAPLVFPPTDDERREAGEEIDDAPAAGAGAGGGGACGGEDKGGAGGEAGGEGGAAGGGEGAGGAAGSKGEGVDDAAGGAKRARKAPAAATEESAAAAGAAATEESAAAAGAAAAGGAAEEREAAGAEKEL